MKKMPFDTEKDLVPVSLVSIVTLVLTVHPSVPARSVKELIALAKSKPGSLNYGSAGNASANHLATERFSYMAGIKMVHIPYKGGGPAVVSIVGGETAVLFATIPSAIQHFQSGRLIPLGVSSLKRNSALPDVPSIAEAAIPGFEAIEWNGVVVPAGTPAAVITQLNQALVKALSIPEVKERIIGLGADPVGSSPEEFGAFIKKEIATWARSSRKSASRSSDERTFFHTKDGLMAGGTWIEQFPGNMTWSNAALGDQGMAPYGAVALGEIDEVWRDGLSSRQDEPDAWQEEWCAMGRRIEKVADRAAAEGRQHTAGNYYLRAGMYYFTGERFIYPGPAKLEVGRKSLQCQRAGLERRYPNMEFVEGSIRGNDTAGDILKGAGR